MKDKKEATLLEADYVQFKEAQHADHADGEMQRENIDFMIAHGSRLEGRFPFMYRQVFKERTWL